MRTLLLFFFAGVTLFTQNSLAQNANYDCSNGRFVNDLFSSVTPTMDIVYGYNTVPSYTVTSLSPFPPYTYSSASTQVSLLLDLYEPTGDLAAKRPLIVLAFGGSYIYNERSQLAAICAAYARKGYVAATIDYRKIPNTTGNLTYYFADPDKKRHLADEVAKTSADMKAAIRFLKHNAGPYRIDTTKIFIGGYSSGAITALHTAYIDSVAEIMDNDIAPQFDANGGIEGNTDLQGSNSLLALHTYKKIAGVLNISGAIFKTSWITNGSPILYSMHGTDDAIVPFSAGSLAFPSPLIPGTFVAIGVNVFGSDSMRQRANAVGVFNKLDTLVGGDHYAPTTVANQVLAITNSSLFFAPLMCPSILPITLSSFTVQSNNCTALLRWQTASEVSSSRFDIEMSEDGNNYRMISSLPSRNTATGASYMYSYKASGTAYFRLKMVDKDGSFTYSPVQKFRSSCGSLVQLFPNPAVDQTTISGLEAGMQVRLLNVQGQTLWSKKAGSNTLSLPLSTFANGLYVVQVSDDAGEILFNTKLIKK